MVIALALEFLREVVESLQPAQQIQHSNALNKLCQSVELLAHDVR